MASKDRKTGLSMDRGGREVVETDIKLSSPGKLVSVVASTRTTASNTTAPQLSPAHTSYIVVATAALQEALVKYTNEAYNNLHGRSLQTLHREWSDQSAAGKRLLKLPPAQVPEKTIVC